MAIYYTPSGLVKEDGRSGSNIALSGLVKEDGRSGSNIALRVARKAEAEWPIYHTPSGSVKEDV
jgi:cytochrome c-type biogenesis protein CcmE